MTKKSFRTFEECVCCGRISDGGNTYHHLYTRGAYPELEDETWNKIPVCGEHHIPWFHNYGLTSVVEKFPNVKTWLLKHDWVFSTYLEKWTHEMPHKREVSI